MNLISKKDLLAITGISYGQLYRWKRERLIPEEWFIKQSAYTGQETFFPREQILSRIKSILDLKDNYSLEELAKILSPEASAAKINREDLQKINEIDRDILFAMPQVYQKEQFEISETALAAAISQVRKKLDLSNEQAIDLFEKSIQAASAYKNMNVTFTIFLAEDRYHSVFYQNTSTIAFDEDIEIKAQINLSETADIIKLKYKNLFIK